MMIHPMILVHLDVLLPAQSYCTYRHRLIVLLLAPPCCTITGTALLCRYWIPIIDPVIAQQGGPLECAMNYPWRAVIGSLFWSRNNTARASYIMPTVMIHWHIKWPLRYYYWIIIGTQ